MFSCDVLGVTQPTWIWAVSCSRRFTLLARLRTYSLRSRSSTVRCGTHIEPE